MRLIAPTADILRKDSIKGLEKRIIMLKSKKITAGKGLEKSTIIPGDEERKQKENKLSINIQEYIEKLIAYIPKEMVFLYFALTTILSGIKGTIERYDIVLWVVVGIIFVLTIIWIYRGVSDSGIQIRSAGSNTHFRAFISAIAFLTWVAAIGEPFTFIAGYHIEYGRAAVVLLTVLIPGLGWKLKKE